MNSLRLRVPRLRVDRNDASVRVCYRIIVVPNGVRPALRTAPAALPPHAPRAPLLFSSLVAYALCVLSVDALDRWRGAPLIQPARVPVDAPGGPHRTPVAVQLVPRGAGQTLVRARLGQRRRAAHAPLWVALPAAPL